ncbi:MAG: carboxypeptidase regulatory-like domain-containing protein, partial [Terriglobia bacterium]
MQALTGATLRGLVTLESQNAPVHGASVLVVQLGRSTLTDNVGVFEFTNLAPGRYTVVVHSHGLSDKQETAELKAGEITIRNFQVRLSPIKKEITVAASGREETTSSSFQTVGALESVELAAKAKTSLREVLENQPGVAKRGFGPGSSPPAIRNTNFAAGQKPEGGTSPPGNTKQIPALSPPIADKADSSTLSALKVQIDDLKAEYEKRIQGLEAQLEEIQKQLLQAAPESAVEPASQPDGRVVQSIPGALNPAISVVGNFVGRGDSSKVFNDELDRIDNKMNLREAEIDMRVPIDPYADGVLIASLESETPGRFTADVEEGYVNIKKLPFLDHPPLGLKLKVGRFRPAFGKFNVLHTHDLPQTFRSLPTEEFLGAEGFIQNGISGSFFIPTPWDDRSSLDATVEVLNGGDIALSPSIRNRASYLGHLRWFRTFKDAHNLELGWSQYFHPPGNQAASANMDGIDFLYRWKPLRQGEWKSYLIGGEWMQAHRSYPEALEPIDVARAIDIGQLLPGTGKPKGYSVFTQWQFDRRKYAGLRWDQTATLFNPSLQRRSLTTYFSYYFSEFLR